MRERPWAGRKVVCIASGPSLTPEDCELVHQAGHPTVVTNTTFQLCPWADALFAFDAKWWRIYREEVDRVFRGRKFCASWLAPKFGAETAFTLPIRIYRNSGACAISLAMAAGAASVVLLGYDAGFSRKGRKHWHDDHPAGLENAETIGLWADHFAALAMDAAKRGIEILNASRTTRLICFQRVTLEAAL